jgi:superfamily II DNA helicase RecQ
VGTRVSSGLPQLSRLRTQLSDLPIAAFTASATRQVRHDILKQLQMRARLLYRQLPSQNLRYVVHECEARTQMELLSRACGTMRERA